jgi:hypothetical protein
VQAAVRKDVKYLPLALVPVAFGLQQFSEGAVWIGLHRDDLALVRPASLVFLFFAIGFWPFWIPLSVLMIETRRQMRWLLGLLTVAGMTWFWLYYSIAENPGEVLETLVVKHSIRYEVTDIAAFHVAPRAFWRLAYVAVICVSLALAPFEAGSGSKKATVWGGLLIAGLFLVSYFLYWHAFLSVWCFFAAVTSLLLCSVFYKLPKPAGAVPLAVPVVEG